MNNILLPQVTFKNIISDESRVKAGYARIFNIAKKNILLKRQLTSDVSLKYTKIQYGKRILINRRSGKNVKS